MAKKLTEQEINSRLLNHIRLVHGTFKNTMTKAVFIDSDFGEWSALVGNVLKGSEHPERGKLKLKASLTSSAEEIEKLLPSHIKLDKSTYVNQSTKARFMDDKHGEWWTKPLNIIHAKSGHPKRANNQLLDNKEVQGLLSEIGYVQITEYKGKNEPITLQCNGCKQIKEYKKFGNIIKCNECKLANKYISAFNKRVISENLNFQLLDCYRHNGKYVVKYKSNSGNVFVSDVYHFLSRKQVPAEIYGTAKKSIEYIKELMLKEGYDLLSDSREKTYSQLRVKSPYGIIYNTTYNKWMNGVRCPSLRNNIPRTEEKIRSHIDMLGQYSITKLYDLGLDSDIEVSCLKSGHVRTIKLRQAIDKRGKCLVCARENYSSESENEIADIISTHFTIEKNLKFIPPYEIDICVPEKKLAIEYCGLYWHSDVFKEKNYHKNKLDLCKKKGYSLLTIFEDEWINRRGQVLNIIFNKLGLNKKLYARNFEVCEIDKSIAVKFINDNHLQMINASNIMKSVALIADNEIYGVISLGLHHRDSKKYILNRMVFKSGYSIVGGASKMFKYISNGLDEIITFADKRYFSGEVYEIMGFKLDIVLKPDYAYVKSENRYSKQSLKKKKGEEQKTENELRREQGYLRIWDCGKIRYVWKRM